MSASRDDCGAVLEYITCYLLSPQVIGSEVLLSFTSVAIDKAPIFLLIILATEVVVSS